MQFAHIEVAKRLEARLQLKKSRQILTMDVRTPPLKEKYLDISPISYPTERCRDLYPYVIDNRVRICFLLILSS